MSSWLPKVGAVVVPDRADAVRRWPCRLEPKYVYPDTLCASGVPSPRKLGTRHGFESGHGLCL